MEDIERGSLSQDTKANSLLGRWFNKAKLKIESKKEEASELKIERDGIVACNATQLINDKGNKKEEVTKQRYRMLFVYAKSYRKWFMTADKQRCSKYMKEDELNKYRCAIGMINDGFIEDY